MTKRLTAVILCLLMLVGFLPLTYAEAATAADDEPIRFILVLDCSDSMEQQDPNYLCAKACEIFVNLMPVENTRVGIVGMGDTGLGSSYEMQKEASQLSRDQENIRVLLPIEDAETVKQRDISADIQKAVNASANITPIGNGLLTALDMLKADGTPSGKGCIIMISDGHTASLHTPLMSNELADDVSKKAGNLDWPIYTLQIHAIEDPDGAVQDRNNTAYMKSWASTSGGSYYDLDADKLSDELEITQIFTGIFDSYMDADGTTTIVPIENGVGQTEFDIPILTSEAKIIITGSSIVSVDLVSPDGTTTAITRTTSSDRIMATVNRNAFVSVTMICPLSGTWTVVVHGDKDARVLRYSYAMQNPELVLTTPDYKGETLSKVDSVEFLLHYEYRGTTIPYNDAVYTVKQPKLVLVNQNGRELDEKPTMTPGALGYALTLEMSALGQGTFTAMAKLSDSTGDVVSNSIQVTVENRESGIAEGSTELPDRDAYIHEGFDDFERIDLEGKINNPDGDKLIFVVQSDSGRDIHEDPNYNGIDYKIEDGYLYLTAGDVEEEYEINVGFREVDVKEFTYFDPFTFTVTQREFSYDGPDNVELWCDEYSWYKDVATPQPASVEYDLTDSYRDPDGDELIISDVKVKITPANDKVEKVLDWDYDEKTGELSIESYGAGTAVVTYTVSDGYTEEDISFNVKVVSGKARFWAQNAKWFVLAAILIAVLIIALIFLSAVTRIKGFCDISFENETQLTSVMQPIHVKLDALRCTKKKKYCSLKDLINSVIALIPETDDPNGVLPQVQAAIGNRTAKKVILRGVAAGKGFVIDKNFASADFTVENKAKNAKVRVGAGQAVYLKLTETTSGDEIKITMKITGK